MSETNTRVFTTNNDGSTNYFKENKMLVIYVWHKFDLLSMSQSRL